MHSCEREDANSFFMVWYDLNLKMKSWPYRSSSASQIFSLGNKSPGLLSKPGPGMASGEREMISGYTWDKGRKPKGVLHNMYLLLQGKGQDQ